MLDQWRGAALNRVVAVWVMATVLGACGRGHPPAVPGSGGSAAGGAGTDGRGGATQQSSGGAGATGGPGAGATGAKGGGAGGGGQSNLGGASAATGGSGGILASGGGIGGDHPAGGNAGLGGGVSTGGQAGANAGTGGGGTAGTAGASGSAGAPRLVAPLSGATVTSRRPVLRWALPPAVDGAHIQLCHDRLCLDEITSFDAPGTSGSPPSELSAGNVFWRVTGRVGSEVGHAYSYTWQFTVGARSAPVNGSFGKMTDVNGDGFSDLFIGQAGKLDQVGTAYVYPGGTAGPPTSPSSALTGPNSPPDACMMVRHPPCLAGNLILVGAGDLNGDGYADMAFANTATDQTHGRIQIHLGGSGGISIAPVVTLTDPDPADLWFGDSMAGGSDLDGDGYPDLVVTSRSYLYVFGGGPNGISTTPSTRLSTDPVSCPFGPLSSAGDINGDGYADVVVGGFGGSCGGGIYLGGPAGLMQSPGILVDNPVGPDGYFGSTLAQLGDVNGDGYGDVAFGAYSTTTLTGVTYVFLGGTSGRLSNPVRLDSNAPSSATNPSVAGVGDVNGDGYADLAVGNTGNGNSDHVSVYLGGPGGISVTPLIVQNAGGSVAGVGDLDGDGYADLAVTTAELTWIWRVHIFLGGASGPSTSPSLTLVGPDPQMTILFGATVASLAPRRARAGRPVPAP